MRKALLFLVVPMLAIGSLWWERADAGHGHCGHAGFGRGFGSGCAGFASYSAGCAGISYGAVGCHGGSYQTSVGCNGAASYLSAQAPTPALAAPPPAPTVEQQAKQLDEVRRRLDEIQLRLNNARNQLPPTPVER